jgi:DNA-binding NtrC family response regulator
VKPYREAKLEWQKSYLEKALRQTNGNRSLAAQISGMNRQGFQKLLAKHGIPAKYAYRKRVNGGNDAWQSLSRA